MRKLLVITDLFPDRFSPNSEVFVQQQVRELGKVYEVRVIATRFRQNLSFEQDIRENYQVTYIYLPLIKYLYLSRLVLYKIYAVPVIDRIIQEFNPELIHVHDCRHIPELFLLRACLSKYKIPKFLTVHNIRTHPVMLKSLIVKWLYGMFVRQSYNYWKHIFSVNDRITNILMQDAEIKAITTIGNAVGPVPEIDKSQLEPYRKILSETDYKIISVGNLKQEKGFDILINAVSKLTRAGYAIQVVIVGRGKEKDKLVALINSLGLSGKIILTGDLNNEILRNLYPLFDAFVLPSYSETFGIVYIEAMQAGLPVIGVKGQGIDGVVKQQINGLLAGPKDVTSLKETIQYLIDNQELASKMAHKGQKLIQDEFQLAQLIGKIINIYEQ
jgi:teichuronic acid biosynthesis glycosyltransferase TuaC